MTESRQPQGNIVRFGVFEVDLAARRLTKRGRSVHLQDQPFRVLEALLEKPGEIVTQDELRDRLWPDGENVEFEKGIRAAVKRLRDALADDSASPRFIETAQGLGYKFIAPIAVAVPTGEQQRANPWRVAALGALGAALLAFAAYEMELDGRGPPPETATRTVQFGVPPPPGRQFMPIFRGGRLALSPDGAKLAFVATDALGNSRLWVHDLASGESRELDGTEGASFPFWSPDGAHLGFRATNELRRIPAGGGIVQRLCAAPGMHSAAWSPDGVIVFGHRYQGLKRIPADGGIPEPATVLDPKRADYVHRHPRFLPDGRRFLFVSATQEAKTSVRVGSLDESGVIKSLLIDTDSKVQFTQGASGLDYLMYLKGTTLFVQRIDLASLELRGRPTPIAQGVESYNAVKRANFSVSGRGVLAFRLSGGGTTQADTQLTWFDRAGRELGNLGEARNFYALSLAPDDSRVVVAIGDLETFTANLWLHDFERGAWDRLTTGSFVDKAAVWSPDSRMIAFGRTPRPSVEPGTALYTIPASGGHAEKLILKNGVHNFAMSWAPDGSKLIYTTSGAETQADIWELTLAEAPEATPLLRSEFVERAGKVSPTGEWIAYTSNRTGVAEVYVARYPEGGDRTLISAGGGIFPLWRGDGQELFFIRDDNTLMAADTSGISDGRAPQVRELFQTQISPLFASTAYPYGVTANGERFLMKVEPQDRPLRVVLNWESVLPNSIR